MKLREIFTPSPARWIGAGVFIVVAALLAWWLTTAPARHKTEAATAKVETALSGSRQASAQAATEIVVRAGQRDAAADQLTRETSDAIHNAPGADLRLNPGLNRAALVGLCKRPAYCGRPECLQFADPLQPSKACPRR